MAKEPFIGARHASRSVAHNQYNVEIFEWANGRAAKLLSKCKHIDIKQNYVMSIVNSDLIMLVTVRTANIIADFLTKPLAPKDLKRAIDFRNVF